MKKILLLLVSMMVVFSAVGCVEIVTTTTQPATTTTQPGATTTTDVLTGTQTTTTRPVVYGDLPEDEVEISFWHIYGAGKTALLDTMIAEFEEMFPNVTITSTSQSDYVSLLNSIKTAVYAEIPPTMALGYPDHYAEYVDIGAAYALDNFINSNVVYEIVDSSSSIFGETVTTGLDLSDFPQSYLSENNQYQGGYFYSVPYSKSTETMAVNVDVLKAHVAEIRALGITISDNGYLSHEVPLTFTQIQALGTVLLSDLRDDSALHLPVTDVANKECAYLVNYDSSGNMFINMSRQFGAPYTNSQGYILIDNDTTRSMLNFIDAMFNNYTFALPIAFDQSYGSTNFKYGDLCMTVGSTAGVVYNIPTAADVQDNLKLGIFDVDFLQVPQLVTADGQTVTVNDGEDDYTFTGYLSAVQQGPNIGIFKDASSAERLYAWLFIKYLTNTDNTARWAMDTGYLPARLSAYTSEVPIQLTGTFSTTYAEFLEIAQDFWAADGNPGWDEADVRWDYLHKSMVANIAKNQTSYYEYDPAFAGQTVAGNSGSATVRIEAGYCLENMYTDAFTPEGALANMKSLLMW